MDFNGVKDLFFKKKGLEVGGPSRIFQNDGAIPIYQIVEELDGCNFSSNTLWEKNLKDGQNYKFNEDKEPGYQFICEATSLQYRIDPMVYDFVVSSNCLEHIANPLKAIWQFLYVTKIGGMILLVLPKKEATFDHNRLITTYNHLYNDYRENIPETDLSHLSEILSLHDLSMDPPAGNIEQFNTRSMANYSNRGLHHHVFDDVLLSKIFQKMRIKTIGIWDISSEYVALGERKI